MLVAVRHRRLRRSVERLIDHEASPREAEVALAHLRHCRTCRVAARVLLRLKAALRRRAGAGPDPLAVTRLRRFALAVSQDDPHTN